MQNLGAKVSLLQLEGEEEEEEEPRRTLYDRVQTKSHIYKM